MKNLQMSIDGDEVLTITVNLRQVIGESRSGRSDVISHSHGNLRLANADGTFRDEVLNFSITKRREHVLPRARY